MIVLASIIVVISALTIAMVLKARKNTKERNRRMIEYWKDRQRYARLGKWEKRGIEWDEERKRPVKVQFT